MSNDAPIIFNYDAVCPHGQWKIDRHHPEVKCAECDKVLDPYWCLREFAAGFRSQDWKWSLIQEHEKKQKQRELTDKMRRQRIKGIVSSDSNHSGSDPHVSP